MRTVCDGNECGGVGYEQLAAHGTAGCRVFKRYLRRSMDGDRTGDRYLFKLADRRKETQKIQREDKFDHDAGFLFEPVPR